MDKDTLLPRVVDQVKHLRTSSEAPIPAEADDVSVECCTGDDNGLFIKASVSCDDRPDLFVGLVLALSLRPRTMDKDTLLARVVDQVKHLRRTTSEATQHEPPIPAEADDVSVECCTGDDNGLFIKASVSCDDWPDLFVGLVLALSLRLRTMDKETLLARVVDQVKHLRRTSSEATQHAPPIPAEADDVSVECCTGGDNGLFIMASVSCDDRPDLFVGLVLALHNLRLRTVVRTEQGRQAPTTLEAAAGLVRRRSIGHHQFGW